MNRVRKTVSIVAIIVAFAVVTGLIIVLSNLAANHSHDKEEKFCNTLNARREDAPNYRWVCVRDHEVVYPHDQQ